MTVISSKIGQFDNTWQKSSGNPASVQVILDLLGQLLLFFKRTGPDFVFEKITKRVFSLFPSKDEVISFFVLFFGDAITSELFPSLMPNVFVSTNEILTNGTISKSKNEQESKKMFDSVVERIWNALISSCDKLLVVVDDVQVLFQFFLFFSKFFQI